MRAQFRTLAKQILPEKTYRRLVLMTRNPPVGRIDFGDLRSLQPISDVWGYDRGMPIDRYYIDGFLEANQDDICGKVLEIGDDYYTRRFGGDRVLSNDVLHVSSEFPKATMVADLTKGQQLPENAFDCIICTQTFQFIYEIKEAIASCHKMLVSGGVVLATFPGIAQISRYDMDHWGDYWRLTSASAQRIFADIFEQSSVEVTNYGNVLASIAFLHGIAVEELKGSELDFNDPDYQLLISVKAVKSGA